MKIKTIALCILSTISVFVSAQETYTIKGTAGKDMDGKQLYIYQLEDGQTVKEVLLDSAAVKKGKFAFSGVQEQPRIAIIKQAQGDKAYPVILEKGKITMNIVTDRRGGTLLNDTLDVAIHELQPYVDKMTLLDKELRTLYASVKPEEALDKIKNDSEFKKKIDEFGKKGMALVDSILPVINSHKNSLVGVYLFTHIGGAMLYKDTESIKEGASPVFLNHILVKKSIEQKELFFQGVKDEAVKRMSKEEREHWEESEKKKAKRTKIEAKIKIGEHFPDAKVKDTAGKEVTLADYVGKGKYVLIDFWASWCGPCRREMPNVKAAYEKYASKGFEVVSISTDAKLKDWENAVQELGMTWTQLLNVDAADVYGIFAIPTTFLVDPDGTIVEKNLRGKELGETLAKLFE